MAFDLSRTYTAAGDYTLVVTVTDDDGGMGSAQITITVLPEDEDTYFLPEAGTAQTVDEGALVQFAGSMIDPGDPDALLPTSITWDFGDLTGASGSLTPTHTYLDDGAFTANLTFAYADGAEFSDTVLITVNNVAPVVYISGDAAVMLGELFTRAGSFSDPGADTWTATVDYGDGAGAQTLNLSGMTFDLAHTYTTAGDYTLTVTVSDDDGGEGSASITVTVTEEEEDTYFLPEAGTAQTVNEGAEVQFSGSSIDPGDPDALLPTSITWDFGNGTPAVTGTLIPTHVYADNGVYTATLTFAYVDDAEYSDTVLITVDNVAPSLDLGEDATVALNTTLVRSGAFTDPGADTWTATVDYGDGAGAQALTLTGMNFELEHTYLAPGTYTLIVTVSDDDGGLGTARITVTVTGYRLNLPFVIRP
jgi:PKD repeat protein